jgi:hypothetical protein
MIVEILNQEIDISSYSDEVQKVLTDYAQFNLSDFEQFEFAQNFIYDKLGNDDCIQEIEMLLGF